MKKTIMKVIVNMLTISRIILSFILLLNFKSISGLFFLITIVLLFMTDFLDGFLARKFSVQTNFGATMDTIADKTLCIILVLLLCSKYRVSYLLLIGEVIIGLLNMFAYLKGLKTKSSYIGKIKMWFLSISIILGYACYYGYVNNILFTVCSIITNIFQLFVFVNYIIMLYNQMKTGIN